MIRRGVPWRTLLVLMAVLSACSVFQARVEQRDVPDGPPQALGLPAKGPIIVVGQGVAHGVGWRYSVYESAEGWCTQMELAGSGGTGCGGDLAPPVGSVFGSFGWGSGDNEPVSADGTVTGEVAAVALIAGGQTFNATLMSLERAGSDGQAFVAFAPAGTAMDSLVAYDADGEVLARELLRE